MMETLRENFMNEREEMTSFFRGRKIIARTTSSATIESSFYVFIDFPTLIILFSEEIFVMTLFYFDDSAADFFVKLLGKKEI